ncbi:MAG TPA: hypothetical protein DCF63_08850 [Planctomycetaceae bacterium]|nr:hypothetical protein [Planctomycetaceae bacterium]
MTNFRALAACLMLASGRFLMAQSLLPDAEISRQFAHEIQPVLLHLCSDCHQGDSAEAGIALDRLTIERAGTIDRHQWVKVHGQIAAGAMPPPEHPQPSQQQRKQLAEWIEKQILTVRCEGPAYPGRVTVRRLNRDQYNRTVADLIGVSFQPASRFPSDDVGYGFDNIGDVLNLSPVLLERFMEAADEIARRAIVVPSDEGPPLKSISGKLLTSSVEQAGGQVAVTIAGEYLFRIKAYGQQAGPQVAQMEILVDNKPVSTVDVPNLEQESGSFEVKQRLTVGQHQLTARFVNDYYRPEDPDPQLRGDRNLMVESLELVGPISVSPEDLPESHRRLLIATVNGESDRNEVLRAVQENLSAFLPRAFRRPTTGQELERYTQIARMVLADGGSFERAMQVAVQAVLVSPNFLFRIEQDTASEESDMRRLSDFELASRLSYFLWNSQPDDQLYQLANSGQLGADHQLRQQVMRMLTDPRSTGFVQSFTGQWLQLRKLETLSIDRQRFPSYSDPLRSAMQQETILLVASILHEGRTIFDLLTADYAYVNQALAEHYGVSGVEGNQFQRVSLAGVSRRGLLGQAAILTVTSNPTRTSPVKRGKWILDNLLGMPPAPPPPNVPDLEQTQSSQEKKLSLREQVELHRSKPQCAGCHQLMDPLGFGLENFDVIGAWRDLDAGVAIDPSGQLPDGRQFSGPTELSEILMERKAGFRRCLAEKLLTYALGRGLEYFDQCTLNQVTEATEAEGDTLVAMIQHIVLSRPFRWQAKTKMPGGRR